MKGTRVGFASRSELSSRQAVKKIEPTREIVTMPDGEVLTVTPDGEIVNA